MIAHNAVRTIMIAHNAARLDLLGRRVLAARCALWPIHNRAQRSAARFF
jgi:hypothetical protein